MRIGSTTRMPPTGHFRLRVPAGHCRVIASSMAWIYMNESNTSLSNDHQLANRYALATVDMEEVIGYLDCYDQISRLHDGDDESLWAKTCHGLLSAAIVAYCRPFSSNFSKGYAAAKLCATALASVKERRVLHDLLVEKRNTFIAHADWKARNVELAVPGPVSLHAAFSEPDIWRGMDVKEFRLLADGVRQDCIFLILPHARAGAGPADEV
jgi:hypothetical protein